MSLAIKRENGDLLWFDAVLDWNRSLSGNVSSHPLENGGVITDHTTINNEAITFNGILTDADFNLSRPVIDPAQAQVYGITNKQFVNNTPVNQLDSTGTPQYNNVTITDTGNAVAYLPESVGQFFSANAPTVRVSGANKVKTALAVKTTLIDMFNGREKFVLLSFMESRIEDAFENCVMTSLSFREDSETGSGVYPNISLQRVAFANSSSVKITQRVAEPVQKKAAAQQNKGGQSTSGTTITADLNAKTQPFNRSAARQAVNQIN